jgi:hypothetical protein
VDTVPAAQKNLATPGIEPRTLVLVARHSDQLQINKVNLGSHWIRGSEGLRAYLEAIAKRNMSLSSSGTELRPHSPRYSVNLHLREELPINKLDMWLGRPRAGLDAVANSGRPTGSLVTTATWHSQLVQ